MSRLLALLLAVVLVAAPSMAVGQGLVARFEITAVNDTTLSFRSGSVKWVKPGLAGVAVDPRRRDQMVARFRVLSVRDGVATAVITGQTTDVSADHVATAAVPAVSWYRRGSFWFGLLLGGVLGAAGVAAS